MPNPYDNVVLKNGTTKTISENGTVTVTTSGPYRVGGGIRTWGGGQTRVKPSPLPLFPSACSSEGFLYFDTFETWQTKAGASTVIYNAPSGNRYGTETIYSVRDSNGPAIARSKADARFGTGPLNALVQAGEAPETTRFVARRIFTLAQAFNLIRKGRFADAASMLKTELSRNASKRLNYNRDRYRNPADLLANSWLEYQFGIAPLIKSVYDAVDAYHQRHTVGSVVRASARYQAGPDGSIYKAGIAGIVKSSEIRTLQQLGILNPAAAILELLPLSFVVEWFLPVGRYFQGFGATLGLTNVVRWNSTLHWDRTQDKGPLKRVSRLHTAYTRGTGSGWSFPFPLPESNLNSGKVITAIALLQRTYR